MMTAQKVRDMVTEQSAERAPRTRPHAALAALARVVHPLAEALGPGVEVVLHDLSLIPNSIIAIGGSLTGRSVGGPMTDLLMSRIQQADLSDLLRYEVQYADGRRFLSSTIFIKQGAGKSIGCLCLNLDVTEWRRAKAVIDSFLTTAGGSSNSSAEDVTEERFVQTVEDLTISSVSNVISTLGVPVGLMRKEHKLEIVRQLEERGIFLIRDALDYIAGALGVSRHTIYNYLNELNEESRVRLPNGRQATLRALRTAPVFVPERTE